MKNKKFLFVLLCGVLLFALTGCGNKKAITMSEFKSAVEDAGLTVLDSDSSEGTDSIKEIGTAYSEDFDVMAMFYIYESKSAAEEDFEDSVESIDTKSNTSISMGNYNTFEGSLDDDELSGYDYIYISRVDDTILMFVAKSEKKSEVKDIVKKLGY